MGTFELDPVALPGHIPEGLELFAIGDVHGQAALLGDCLDEIGRTPRPGGASRVIVFLGDLIDRGPDSPGAVRLFEAAAAKSGADRVVLLPGNHELMFLEAVGDDGDPQAWLHNGGSHVIAHLDPDWRQRPWPECRALLRDAFGLGWIAAIAAAPSHAVIGDLILVHAGLDPKSDRDAFLERDRSLSDDHWAGIRHEFVAWEGGWDIDADGNSRRGPTVVVHGHTPAIRQHVRAAADLEPMDGIAEYRAICLDAGAAYRPQLGWARFMGGAVTTASLRVTTP